MSNSQALISQVATCSMQNIFHALFLQATAHNSLKFKANEAAAGIYKATEDCVSNVFCDQLEELHATFCQSIDIHASGE